MKLPKVIGRMMFGAGVRIAATAARITDGLEAGQHGRRMKNWMPTRLHVNTLIQQSGNTVAARARYLKRNNPDGAAIPRTYADTIIGNGMQPQWNNPAITPAVRKALKKKWRRWSNECDADAKHDFEGMLWTIAQELGTAGEIFARLRPRYLRDKLSVPLQLQLLPSEQLPMFNNPGLGIRHGIQFDQIGRRIAYHFWKEHPGDSTLPQTGAYSIVPAEGVLHVALNDEPGQLRGLTLMSPVIVPIWTNDAYLDAEVDRKRTAALHAGFIETGGETGTPSTTPSDEAAVNADGAVQTAMEPGAMIKLLPGEKITFSEPADVGGNFEAFQYRMGTRVAAGVRLPYPSVSGDLTKSSFANSRVSLIDTRRGAEVIQNRTFVFQFCRPVMNAWLDALFLLGDTDMPGYSDDPEPYQDVTWTPHAFAWVDPLKDTQAELLELKAGIKSLSSAIRGRGDDPQETFDEIKSDQDELAARNIVVDFGSLKDTAYNAPPNTPDQVQQQQDAQDAQNAADQAAQDETVPGQQQDNQQQQKPRKPRGNGAMNGSLPTRS